MKIELRYKLEKEEIRRIFTDLQSSGYNLRTLMKLISGFSDTLYKGYTFRESSFKKLCNLYGKHINYSIKSQNNNIKTLNIEINDDLAEVVGIFLGDGSIGHYIDSRGKNLFKMEISFNGIDEKPYLIYVDSLLQKVFIKKPYFYQRKNQKAAVLIYRDKNLYYYLLSIGLKSGNKIKNQVGVPNWIKQNDSFKLRCLKGLFDTDGSIFIDKRYNSIMLEFRNHSQPLLDDFRKMCKEAGINPSPEGNNRVKIQSKRDVKNFLECVQPFKWLIKLKYNDNLVEKLEYKIKRK